MVQTILINPAPHGNGPYIVAADYAQEFASRVEGFGDAFLLVPHIYRKSVLCPDGIARSVQAKILACDQFPHLRKRILLSDPLGDVLDSLNYRGQGTYGDRLATILASQSRAEQDWNRLLNGRLLTRNLDGEEVVIDGRDVAIEIGHNPIVLTEGRRKYLTTIAPFSLLMREAEKLQPSLGYALPDVAGLIAIGEHVEAGQNLILTSTPSTLTYSRDELRAKGLLSNERVIPPFKRPQFEDSSLIVDGEYALVTRSGIGGLTVTALDQTITFFRKAGYNIASGDEGDDLRVSPGAFVAHPQCKYTIGRMGLSTVYGALLLGKPLITFPFDPRDDVEMLCNEKTFRALDLVLFYEGKDPTVRGEEVRGNIQRYFRSLEEHFGTLDGVTFGADLMVKDFIAGGI